MEPKRITPEEVKQRLDRGEDVVFLDTRNPEAWSKSDFKMPGAVRMPGGELERRIREVPRGRSIITYCT